MNKEFTLSEKTFKINRNQAPKKAIIDALMSYSKPLQFVNTSIGKIVIVNN